MKYKNFRSSTHPIHGDIMPVVSALRRGKPQLAQRRFNWLIARLGLMFWESTVVAGLIRQKAIA